MTTGRRATSASWSRALGWSALLVGLFPIVVRVIGSGFGLDRPGWFGDGFVGAALGAAVVLLAAALVASRVAVTVGRLGQEGADLVVDGRAGRRRIARDAVESAVVVPGARGCRVELTLVGGDELVAAADDAASARAVLGATGVDPMRRRTRLEVDGMSRWLALLAVTGGGVLLAPALLPTGRETPAGAIIWLVMFGVAMAFALSASARLEVIVGVDGIHLRSWLGGRFVPFEKLREATAAPTGLLLTWKDGSSDLLPLYWFENAERGARRDAILASVDEALRARSADGEQAIAAGALDRDERTVGAWRIAITDLVRGGGYREQRISVDVLAGLLDRADTPPDRLVAAAVGLRVAEGAGASDRVRIAAARCADDRMRVALERIADAESDEAALEEALAAAEARRTASV